jgi:flavin reductase (DIM6/NTAB) family NADH-FMN oxidoreductase RutF
VVTSTGAAGPSGLTANAVCSLSLDPLLMLVCLDTGSRTLESIRRSRRLAVNVLARHQGGVAAPGGDHVIALAEVERVGAPGGDPLVHFRGGYRSLSDHA